MVAERVTEEGIPRLIYGTAWKEERTEPLTRQALRAGFRGIDTANQRRHYHEAGVGEAVAGMIDEGDLDREDLFLQTKFTHAAGQDHRIPYDPDDPYEVQVEASLESSLEHLGTDYVDSLILHGPSSRAGLAEADREVWRTLEALADGERVERIGVSNVTPDQLEELLEFAERPPAFVQNRCFARMAWDRPTREICEEAGIHYQAFSLLTANQRELRSPEIHRIAERHDRTVPQTVFRFALQAGMIALTGTTSEEHMQQDLACFEFELAPEEVRTIEGVGVA